MCIKRPNVSTLKSLYNILYKDTEFGCQFKQMLYLESKCIRPLINLPEPSAVCPPCFPACRVQPLQALLPVSFLLHQGSAGAPHSHRDVELGVGVASSHAGAGPLQDHRGSVDRSAAVLLALLPGRSKQAALAQAVGLRDGAGVSVGVV